MSPARARDTAVGRAIAQNVALAVAYVAVAQASLLAATEHRVVSSIWLPVGIALFALVRYGLRLVPGFVVAATGVYAAGGMPMAASVLMGLGDALGVAVGAELLRRTWGQRRALARVSDVTTLALCSALSAAIAATIGVITLVASGGSTWATAAALWRVWWTGDAVGLLVMAPFLMVWTARDGSGMVPAAAREAIALLAALAIATDLLFAHASMLVFAVYPMALVVAWRLGPRGAATATLLVTLVASWRTLAGYGSFTAFSATANLYALQFYVALLAVTTMAYAAARAERLHGDLRLKASEARYRMLAQHMPDACVALFDRDLRVVLAEGHALATAGLSKADVEGRHVAELMSPANAAIVVPPLRAALDGRESEFEIGVNHRHYLIRVIPVAEAPDEPIGMLLALDVTARERAQREVAKSRAQLERLSRALLTAQEDERKRVAREVHDELGQALTAVKIGLASASVRARQRHSGEVETRLRTATATLDGAIEAVQRIVLRLRPGVLDSLGPLAALEHEVQQFRDRSGLDVTLTLPPEPVRLGAEEATTLYRTAQEALTNVLRHAQARRVSVTFETRADGHHLEIADDGVGISEDEMGKPSSMGILGMRERAAACGGQVDVRRRPEGGTVVRLRIPAASSAGLTA